MGVHVTRKKLLFFAFMLLIFIAAGACVFFSAYQAPDTTPPLILGARDIEIMEGETVSYRRGVSVEDDSGEEVTLTIDSRSVDTGTPGVYEACYTATDSSGNSSRVTVHVTVLPWSISEEEINQLADEALAGLLTEDMTELDKVNAIYDYVANTVLYTESAEKDDWIRAAYYGLHDHKGDCYVYACTAKLLLTRANIRNQDITKSTAAGTHYWNLIDLGNGWYHFDATPQLSHPRIVLWTDAQLMAFSSANHGTHDYDRNLYPDIN